MMRVARVCLPDDRCVYVELGEPSYVMTAAPWLGGGRTDDVVDTAAAQTLVPVEPSKIVCIGRNYAAHASELGNEVPKEPLLFLKPPSALLPDGGTIKLPPQSSRVEHEVELGLVVGRDSSIWGYTIVVDVTARDLQRSDKTWTRGKGFDTFCPVGPVVISGIDDAALSIQCRVNGELRQDGSTDAMIFRPSALIEYIETVMTLQPGDLIATGTPAGVGPLKSGDTMDVSVEHIGNMSVRVT